jgi:hypothetical protein
MNAPAAATPAAGPLTLTRAAAALLQSGVVVLALAAVALHLIDDNYLPRERP